MAIRAQLSLSRRFSTSLWRLSWSSSSSSPLHLPNTSLLPVLHQSRWESTGGNESTSNPTISKKDRVEAGKNRDEDAPMDDIMANIFGPSSSSKSHGSAAVGRSMEKMSSKSSPDRLGTEKKQQNVDDLFNQVFGNMAPKGGQDSGGRYGGRRHTKMQLSNLKYVKAYPRQVRQWILDAKTQPGIFNSEGLWSPGDYEELDVELPKEVPRDLIGKLRFDLTEEELEAANVSDKVRKLFSFQYASNQEIHSFRARVHREKFGKHELDTGHSAVQVANLTNRIERLSSHMRKNHKDKCCKRKVQSLVHQRRKMMQYLRKRDITSYFKVLDDLNLRDVLTV